MRHHDYREEPSVRFSPDKTMVFFTSNLFGASYVFGVEVKKAENPAAADVKDTAELGQQWKRLRSMGSRLTVQKTEGRGLRPGLLIYVVMTTGAAVGSTGALRRRMAAEMRVMMRPTGRGSIKV
jgi:hypothetical protein